jgi:hypothetical protein
MSWILKVTEFGEMEKKGKIICLDPACILPTIDGSFTNGSVWQCSHCKERWAFVNKQWIPLDTK